MDERTQRKWNECLRFIERRTMSFAEELGIAVQVYAYIGKSKKPSKGDFAKACQLAKDAYMSSSPTACDENSLSEICYRIYDRLDRGKGTLDTIKPEELVI